MNTRLVRFNSSDGIEMVGLLHTPSNSTNKVIIHIHGLNGNFYENGFLDFLAETYTNKGYAFLTFNNRGKDYISDFKKGDDSVVIGGSLERFKDCIYDIDGAVKFVEDNGFNEIIIQGHSYGCNKVLYYYDQKKNNNIKKIILLAPCDTMAEVMECYGDEYDDIKQIATNLVNEGKEDELMRCDFMTNGKIAVGTFYNDFLPGGLDDFIRYRDGTNGKSELLNKIDIPVLTIFGDNDSCVLTQPLEVVKEYLTNNIKNINIQIISGANHSYTNKYKELCDVINNNL